DLGTPGRVRREDAMIAHEVTARRRYECRQLAQQLGPLQSASDCALASASGCSIFQSFTPRAQEPQQADHDAPEDRLPLGSGRRAERTPPSSRAKTPSGTTQWKWTLRLRAPPKRCTKLTAPTHEPGTRGSTPSTRRAAVSCRTGRSHALYRR